MDKTMMFHPDLLPETADPVGSVRHKGATIARVEIMCKEAGVIKQYCEATNTLIIWCMSPTYTENDVKFLKGTVLEEANGTYSWWEDII